MAMHVVPDTPFAVGCRALIASDMMSSAQSGLGDRLVFPRVPKIASSCALVIGNFFSYLEIAC